MSILLINQQLQLHLTNNGAEEPFKMSITNIYTYLHTCGITSTYIFKNTTSYKQANDASIED